MLRGMIVFPVRQDELQALLMVFDDAALVMRGTVEGDGFTVLPGCVERVATVTHPEVLLAIDEAGNWNYLALIGIYRASQKKVI